LKARDQETLYPAVYKGLNWYFGYAWWWKAEQSEVNEVAMPHYH
jgi:hypothetical protein